MSPRTRLGASAEATRRTECLWACLEAIDNYFSGFLGIAVDQLGLLRLTSIAQISFAIVTAARLLLLEDPDWDLRVARKSLDLAGIMLGVEQRFQAATAYETAGDAGSYRHAGARGRKTRFVDDGQSLAVVYRDEMRRVRRWYLSKPADDSRAPTGPAAADSAGSGMDLDAGFAGSAVDLDAACWEAFLERGATS